MRIVVGEPVEVADLINKAKEQDLDPQELYAAISLRIGQRLAALWSTLEGKPLPAWAVIQSHTSADTDSVLWSERCFKGMWTIGTDWRPLSLFQMASGHHSDAMHMLAGYLEYCKQRTIGVRSIVETC